jgi:Fe-S cluster assembly protein SufD
MSALAGRILAEFEAAARSQPATADAIGARLRSALAGGLPTGRDENWKYAALRGLEKASFRRPAPPDAARLQVAAAQLPQRVAGHRRLVFVDGFFAQSLSDPSEDVRGVTLLAPGAAPTSHTHDTRDFRYAIINEAFAPVSLAIEAQRDAPLAIEVCAVTTLTADAGAAYPRLLLRAASEAQLSVVERHLSAPDVTALTNVAVEIEAAAAGMLRHVRLQQHGPKAQFVETLRATLAADARYELTQVSLGSQAARTTARIVLAGRGAECAVHAAAIADAARVLDACVQIEHLAPQSRTHELVRAIAAGRARVAFNGHIRMASGATGAESEQSLRGLLSGADCEIDLRPQLEIYVDAVKASHGATTGKLDDQMLFYLLSRGLDPATAQALLKWAFIEDVVTHLANRALRREIEREIATRLGDVPPMAEDALASRPAPA